MASRSKGIYLSLYNTGLHNEMVLCVCYTNIEYIYNKVYVLHIHKCIVERVNANSRNNTLMLIWSASSSLQFNILETLFINYD